MDIFINNEVNDLVQTLEEEAALEFGALYKDKNGNQYQLTRYWSDTLEKELCLLEKLPRKEIPDLISIIFDIDDIEKVTAICCEIADRNFDSNKEYRLDFIEKLERAYSSDVGDADKVRICIGETMLFDATNKDPIVGKSYEQIGNDAKFYRDISDRAKEILDACEKKNKK
ncbi:hypothetical protein [Taibaiella koreensis]|uniref:hypothetical protein n=1 Tax=Taibaiella koreensis TaxID=1268548 RepID=UPI000E59E899|nr:hypothetical protein [Taibaiella koreensis]